MRGKHKIPLRSDIPAELTWDLSPMYADDAAWENDFTSLDALLEAFTAFRGRLAESPATLKQAIEALDELERRGEKLYCYAHLKSDENTADSVNRSRQDRIGAAFAGISAACAWFDPEIMAVPEAKMTKLLASPELDFHRRSLEELLRKRPHTLSEPEERIIGELSDVLGAASKTFSTLNDADLTFKPIRGDNGRKQPVTNGSYRLFLESPKRRVRRAAFESVFSGYKGLEHTFATTLDHTVKEHVVDARLRHYPDTLSAALFDDKIPGEVYTNLIAAVHAKLPALKRYFKLRRKALRLKRLDAYDLYAPLTPQAQRHYTWDEAKKLVVQALAPLGSEYQETLERAFAERWVDVSECKGKRSGAYSSGCYDSYPYLLLNFNGTLNDVFTLAHELGHSLHSYYSNRSQPYHYADYCIFAAEVASITNELLLHDHLVKNCGDRELECYLMNHLADEFRGTVFRQTMFAEFELEIHRLAEAGTPLVADELNRHYRKIKDSYCCGEVRNDPLIAVEWARIPHFYYNFYVYKYATGMAAAVQLSANVLSGAPKNLERYLGFLKAGDSKDVLEILRDAGVDLSERATVEAALDHFEHVVDRLEALLKK